MSPPNDNRVYPLRDPAEPAVDLHDALAWEHHSWRGEMEQARREVERLRRECVRIGRLVEEVQGQLAAVLHESRSDAGTRYHRERTADPDDRYYEERLWGSVTGTRSESFSAMPVRRGYEPEGAQEERQRFKETVEVLRKEARNRIRSLREDLKRSRAENEMLNRRLSGLDGRQPTGAPPELDIIECLDHDSVAFEIHERPGAPRYRLP